MSVAVKLAVVAIGMAAAPQISYAQYTQPRLIEPGNYPPAPPARTAPSTTVNRNDPNLYGNATSPSYTSPLSRLQKIPSTAINRGRSNESR